MVDLYSKLNEAERLNLIQLEALLIAAPGLTSIDQLSKAIEVNKSQVESLLNILAQHYVDCHGIRLQKVKNQYQLTSAAEQAELIEKFLGLEVTSRLTQQAMEVLAIVAYKQPTTRPEIDSIRGVNSDTVVRSLLNKGLIEELGRSEMPGRPFLYGVTEDFLLHFGLDSLDQLPEMDLDALTINRPTTDENELRILKD